MIFLGENLSTGSSNTYDEIIKHILPLTNFIELLNIYSASQTDLSYTNYMQMLVVSIGMEYGWGADYLYSLPKSSFIEKIIPSFKDIDSSLKIYIFNEVLKNSKNPQISFINSWLYNLERFTPYYFNENYSRSIKILDEAQLELND